MLSSTNIGLELPRDIDPCVNWKTTKGKRRAVRRARSSVAGESNRPKAATTSSNGSDNASDEEFKEADQVLASESEKVGVTILGRRFSDTIQSVPIKKRMRLLTGSPAPPPLDSSQASTLEAGSASFVEASLDNHVDFSGISILAEAACKSDLPDEDTNFSVSEIQSPKGENGVVMPREASEVQSPDGTSVSLEGSSTHIETAKEVLNDGSDKSSKAEKVSRDSRLHWDLNTVMDDWDQQEDGNGVNDEQKTASVACNTEVCNNHKEEPEKTARNEDHESTIRNNGDVLDIVAPKESCELHGTELRKEGDIVIEVSPKDSIVESITPFRNCPLLKISPFGPSLTGEEVKSNNGLYSNQLSASEHEQLSMELTTGPELISEECTKEPVEIKEEVKMAQSITDKPLEVNPQLELTTGPELISEECTKEPVEIKEEIKMARSITDKPLEVNPQLELTTGPEPISEECTKESVASAPCSEPKDSVMGNDQAGIDAMMGGDIVEHDSMTGDDKLEHSARQSDFDQLAEEKNHANPSHIETGLMPIIDNDGGHTTVDTEKVDKKVDSSVSDKMGVEVDKHGSSVELPNDGDHSHFYPPKKDLEEDDYQYEDGELREPAIYYRGIDGFEEAETERGHREADERGNYLMEPLPDAPVTGSVTLDAPQGEEKLLVANTSVQLDDCMDTNMIAKTDLESEEPTERLENDLANNLGENSSAEYMHSSRSKSTGWDKQPESSSKNSGSPLKQESRPDSSSRRDLSLGIDMLRSTDDPLRNDDSFVRSRRSKEDGLDARVDRNPRVSRMHGRGGPSRQSDASRRDEHWVETRINTGRAHHRTTEFGAPSYAPSNSGNATAASIAKVKSNGFMVAPDGTLVKTGASGSSRKCQNSSPFYHGSPTERDHRGFRSSRERVVSPERFGGIRGGRPGRCAVESVREQYHRPVIEISPGRRRQRSFSPHRGHIRHISPSHIGSPSRSRTRSPNAWASPGDRCLADHEPRHERGRSPLHRMGPDYGDRLGAPNLVHRNHHHFPSHGPRCVNDRRCTSPVNLMRRSPPQHVRFHPLDSPPPLHRQRDEFYHHPVHSGRCNGFDHRRGFEEDQYEVVRDERLFDRSVNGEGFRPRYSSQKSFESHRSSPRGRLNRGLVGDVNHRGKDRDNFKFGRGGGRRTNGKYEKREMRDRSGGDDDAAERRRLS